MQHAARNPDPYANARQVVDRLSRIMRIRFGSYLAMGIVSAFLIVSSYAFSEGTFIWIAFGGGIALVVLAAIDVLNTRRVPLTAAPAALIAAVGVVMAILAITLPQVDAADVAFGLSIGTGILSVLGLSIHELATESDVKTFAEPPLTP
jgi:hypothetical protein